MGKILDKIIDNTFGKLVEFSSTGCIYQMIFIMAIILALGILIGLKG